jgi:hypothetical protein
MTCKVRCNGHARNRKSAIEDAVSLGGSAKEQFVMMEVIQVMSDLQLPPSGWDKSKQAVLSFARIVWILWIRAGSHFMAPRMSWSWKSALLPSSCPASFQNLLRCLVPLSQSTVTIRLSLPESEAVSRVEVRHSRPKIVQLT